MGSLGIREILPIVVIIIVLFGAKRLPELARSLGQGLRELRKASRDDTSEDKPS